MRARRRSSSSPSATIARHPPDVLQSGKHCVLHAVQLAYDPRHTLVSLADRRVDPCGADHAFEPEADLRHGVRVSGTKITDNLDRVVHAILIPLAVPLTFRHIELLEVLPASVDLALTRQVQRGRPAGHDRRLVERSDSAVFGSRGAWICGTQSRISQGWVSTIRYS